VLGLAVPVLVAAVCGPAGDAEREEREQRSHEIRPGVDRLRDEAEAVRREPDRELQGDEGAGRSDRDECGAPLRAQISSSDQTSRSWDSE
jgi:hypothetical protein